MKLPPFFLFLGGVLLPLTAKCDQPQTSIGAGRAIFEENCASCHGADGRGQGTVARALAVKPADLTRISARRGGQFPENEILGKIDGREEIVSHGSREMPVWGRKFSKDAGGSEIGEEVGQGKLLTLIEYLKTIQVP